mmetsp:Transcript_15251/g.44899  ORF Transcript_15251/g.44899 Transcript_15251/m.44899 type:complete len:213 (+) Transcript_15251:835-1473(+)
MKRRRPRRKTCASPKKPSSARRSPWSRRGRSGRRARACRTSTSCRSALLQERRRGPRSTSSTSRRRRRRRRREVDDVDRGPRRRSWRRALRQLVDVLQARARRPLRPRRLHGLRRAEEGFFGEAHVFRLGRLLFIRTVELARVAQLAAHVRLGRALVREFQGVERVLGRGGRRLGRRPQQHHLLEGRRLDELLGGDGKGPRVDLLAPEGART